VVATSDQPALVRLRAAFTATRIAEWFRDQGMDVVLMMDSLTRFAMPSGGRPLGRRAARHPGLPASVFSLLPRLLERAGAAESGSITGLYTVLVDGDDMDEPIADCAVRSSTATSSSLAAWPRPGTSRPSRSSTPSPGYRAPSPARSRRPPPSVARLLAGEREVKDLVEIGAYVPGTNADADRALALSAEIRGFLCQDMDDPAPSPTAGPASAASSA